jgi:HlyD family secretion protein
MANSKKRRKIIVFTIIGLVLIGLTLAAVFRKRDVVITVQTEKVTRRDLTEIVVANGKIQPVLQVKISPEVSGEIIELPVKEGQSVKKGEMILKIKPDFYLANRNQAEAGYQSSLSGKLTAEANLERAAAEFVRGEELVRRTLISDSAFQEVKTAHDIARAQLTNAVHQISMARALLARAEEDLAKTTMVSPLTGTVSKLNSQLGERVVGTATMAGTEVMTIADLNEMEARVDIGEMDVVLIKPGQKTRLEVDAFKNRKFNGIVTEIANSSRGAGQQSMGGGGGSQEATKFEVKIRITEKENFRPGMSVSADIETQYRTNTLTVPIACVTTRVPKEVSKKDGADKSGGTNSSSGAVTATNKTSPTATNSVATSTKKSKDSSKAVEVVFVLASDHVKAAPVKIGISDENYWEITEGLAEGQEVVSGSYKAISRELEDGKKIRKGMPGKEDEKDKEKEKK